MTEATATAATIAARRSCYVAHVLFVEGLGPCWTDDETGELLGSGAGTWIGESEDALGAPVGEREMLPGLRLPASFRESLDPKTGLLGTQSHTIRLVDYRGVLAELFATEGKPFDLLNANIPAGTTALGASIAIVGTDTTNPRGRHIGLERIGPNGERGYLSPFPFDLIGRHHATNSYGSGEEGPRPIPISDDPIDFTRRKVALYRIVRRNLPPLTGHTAWPLWDDQYDVAGCLVWWGELADRGSVAGNREWDLKVSGAASWTQKTLNSHAPGWKPLAHALIELTPEQRQVAIEFHHHETPGVNVIDRSVVFRTTFTASGDADTWRAELNTLLSDVASGAVSDYGSTDWNDWQQAACGMNEDGSIFVRRVSDDTIGSDEGGVGVWITMSEIMWRAFGFDPPLQDTAPNSLAEETQIDFAAKEAGDPAANGTVVPGDGFWRGSFTSAALETVGVVLGNGFIGDDNYGNPRYYRPVNAGDPLILHGPAVVPQTLLLPIDQPYIEPCMTVQAVSDDMVARYFAIRGKRAVGVPVGPGAVIDENGGFVEYGEMEAEDYGAVFRGEWETGSYGALIENNGHPALAIVNYEDGRKFGVPFEPLSGEWSALNTAEGAGLEIAPLMTYGYGAGASLGRAIECWYQIVLSTGDAAGWIGPESEDPSFLFGANSHGSQDTDWAADTLVADHGLAIPSQLVTEPDDAVDEWDRVPGGVGGPLSRIGLAYVGAIKSTDVLSSIMQPRGLAWSLAGGRYGVVMLAPFAPGEADHVIDQESLYAHPSEPDASIPRQTLRATGQLDKATLIYRYNPLTGERDEEKVYRARDREAQARRGDLTIDLVDDGLVPQEWGVPGVSVWEHDFREFWEIDRAEFFARRHFLVTGIKLHRLSGATVRVGARVRLTNPWPVNPAASGGGYGLTDACGIVTDWQYLPGEQCYMVSVLVFADQFDGIDLFMPIGRIAEVDGDELTLAPEDVDAGVSGAARFDRPSWATGNQANVRILRFDRTTYNLSGVYTIDTVAGDVVTLTSSPTATETLADHDLWLVMAEYAQQTGRWPATYGATIVLDILQHLGGQGSPLEP